MNVDEDAAFQSQKMSIPIFEYRIDSKHESDETNKIRRDIKINKFDLNFNTDSSNRNKKPENRRVTILVWFLKFLLNYAKPIKNIEKIHERIPKNFQEKFGTKSCCFVISGLKFLVGILKTVSLYGF